MGGSNYQSLVVPSVGAFGFQGAGRNSIGGVERIHERVTKPQAHDQMDIDEKVRVRAYMKVRFLMSPHLRYLVLSSKKSNVG